MGEALERLTGSAAGLTELRRLWEEDRALVQVRVCGLKSPVSPRSRGNSSGSPSNYRV
jgi:hypothetical protein